MAAVPDVSSGPLAGRLVVVTGAASGIGRATAEAAAAAGAHVVAVDIHAPDETAAAIVAAGGGASSERLDVGDADGWGALVERLRAEHGRIDALANVAGIAGGEDSILTQTEEGWDRIMRVNLRGCWYAMRAVLPAMVEAGHGRIVNTSSTTAITAMPSSFAYATSKAAVIGMTRQVAIEFADRGIRINAVAPGIVRTPMLGEAAEQSVAAMRAATPVGEIGEPADIAATICHLLGPGAAYITGQVFIVDGGWTAR